MKNINRIKILAIKKYNSNDLYKKKDEPEINILRFLKE